MKPEIDSVRDGHKMNAPRIDVDAAVIGGGHNGLTCAAYLAEAGRSVVVLERDESVGGAARSERVFPDHDAQLSRYAYLVSLLPQLIVDELGLDVTLLQRPGTGERRARRDDGAAGRARLPDDDRSHCSASMRSVVSSATTTRGRT